MKLKRIRLEGYRGFQKPFEVTPAYPLQVFTGENGSGKSTLLDAIFTAISWIPARILSPNGNGTLINSTADINIHSNSATLEITCEDTIGHEIAWKLYRVKRGQYTKQNISSSFQELNAYATELRKQITETKEQCNLPIYSYYTVSRAGYSIPSRIRKHHTFSPTAIYEKENLFHTEFKLFYEWFRDMEALQNQKSREQHDATYVEPLLENVKKAIYTFIPDFSNLHFDWRSPQGLWVSKGRDNLRIEQLPDGEQVLLALVGDLARKLAIANPKRQNPLEGEGIVLIDEIDLHLHPSWQYVVLDKLLNTFPNCQFLITTHSPFVISAAPKDSVSYLKNFELQKIIGNYGSSLNNVAKLIMNVDDKPQEISILFKEFYKALDEDDYISAKEKLNILEQKLNANDPDLTSAQVSLALEIPESSSVW
jgi:predicted ATP-binding protein involved in virulence